MGLLDDAIREHLELKRRRGADPGEIERLEREALGPLRRVSHEAPPDEGAVYRDDLPADDWQELPEESRFADERTELLEADELEEWDLPERGPLGDEGERGPIEGGIAVEPDVVAPATPAPPTAAEAPPAAPGPVHEPDYLEQETVEHEVEGEQPDSAAEDDMLEETPEFLQDTPDHDRLWFEQRPPRDFDLDG